MKKMGVFETLKKEQKTFDNNKEGTEDYEIYFLNDLEENDTFVGKPNLTNIRENEFEDQNTHEMVKKFSATLYINNDENEETLKANVNLKSLDDKISVWQGSLCYDLIDSIEELHEPGTSGINNVYNMNFSELQEYLNNLKTVTVKIKEHHGKFDYNTLLITKAVA
jgi:hypothetical protein